ncbi:MAG: murein biosynthesis integral membrane protein MurJ [Solirubrobacterales bacterium]
MTERTDRVEPGIAIGAADGGPDTPAMEEEVVERERRLGRSTAFFSIATGLSRVAGLVREIFAASYFGVGIQMSAFTIAFLVPNLVRSLFADAALQAAFVPVFTEQLERGRKIEAFRLASTLIFAATLVLGLITALFILLAPWVMPLFAPGYSGAELDLTVSLSRVLFPILIMLGVSGIVVGVLNSYNRFGVFAIAPFFWNVAIIAVLVGLAPAFPSGDEIYAYAIGVVVGTALQLAMVAYDLRNTPFRLRRVFEWRSGLVKRVLLLMLPVTISLGLINFNLAINGIFGSLVPGEGEDAPAAIDKAFRIYMLPQGMFSVAVATVVFPTLARFAARRAFDDLRSTVANGMRMILLVLVPAAAAIFVLSEPMVRLVYQRGDFSAADTDLVATALFWFAFSLPFNGLFLLLTRTFFSLQRPWVPTAISALNLVVTAGVSAALYKPFGVAGIVSATALATFASVIAQMVVLREQLGGIELGSLLDGAVRITAASLVLAAVSWGAWDVLDGAVGRGTIGQIISLGVALTVGAAVYLGAVLALRVPEAKQLLGVLRR